MGRFHNGFWMERLEPRLMLAADLATDVVLFRLQPVDPGGSAIDQVAVGDSFEVEVRVKDLRDDAQGVFSPYLDVEYNASLVSLDGGLEFGDIYINGKSGDLSTPGVLDEAGAFSGSIEPLGGAEFVVFTVQFTAVAAGDVIFSGNPADHTPARDVGVYGLDTPIPDDQTGFEDGAIVTVPNSQIEFVIASLTVVPATDFAEDDSVEIEHGASAASLDVLANDDAVQIIAVTAGSEGGTVSIADDGSHVIFTPVSENFIGVESFEYTAQSSDGSTDSAIVTVHIRSRFQNPHNQFDADGDGFIAPVDALVGINQINSKGPGTLTDDDMMLGGTRLYLDVDGDGTHTPVDILAIINVLNSTSQLVAEGEFSPTNAGDAVATAEFLSIDVDGNADQFLATGVDLAVDAFQPVIASQTTRVGMTPRSGFDRHTNASQEIQQDIRSPIEDLKRLHMPRDDGDLSSQTDLESIGETRDEDQESLPLEEVLAQIAPDILRSR